MKRFLFTFCVLSLAGCQTARTTPPETTAPEPQPKVQSMPQATPDDTVVVKDTTKEVMFMDLSGFDEDLTSNLGEHNKNIVVIAPAKFSLNNIPERLEKWLSAVKQTGGKVQAKETKKNEVATRGILGAIIDLAVSAVKAKKASDQLDTAENYNVLLTYDKQTGEVEDVLFYHR